MHELTESICKETHENQKYSTYYYDMDKVIIEWLEEKELQIQAINALNNIGKGVEGDIDVKRILGLKGESLEEKFIKSLKNVNIGYTTILRLEDIAKQHYKDNPKELE